jgi:hypothetical protein
MRLTICGPAPLTVACALMGALALTSAARAANDSGYPPGASDGLDRDFSGSPPAFRLPAPGGEGAPGGDEAPAAPRGAERDFSGSPPAYRGPAPGAQASPGWREEPGAPEPPATAEGPPAEAGPPMGAPPPYGPRPFGPGFAVMTPGPAYGFPPPMVWRRPAAFVHRPFVYPLPMYRPPPPPMIIAPRPPGFVYGPPPWRALVPGP